MRRKRGKRKKRNERNVISGGLRGSDGGRGGKEKKETSRSECLVSVIGGHLHTLPKAELHVREKESRERERG